MLSCLTQPKVANLQQKEQIAKQIALNKARAAAILQAALRELDSKTPSTQLVKKVIYD